MKKVFAIICLLAITINIFAVASAASNPGTMVQPLWDNTSEVYCELYFYGTTGYATATVKGKSGVSSINATLTLYEKSGNRWVFVNDWEKSVNGTVLTFSESFSAIEGTTYKIELVADVDKSGILENISTNHVNQCD